MNKEDEKVSEDLQNSVMLQQLYSKANAPRLKELKNAFDQETVIVLDLEPGFAALLAVLILNGAAKSTAVHEILTESALGRLVNASHEILEKVVKKHAVLADLKKFFRESKGNILPPQRENFYKKITLENTIEISISGTTAHFPLLTMFINELAQGDDAIFDIITEVALENFKKLGTEMIKQVQEKTPLAKEKEEGEDPLTSLLTTWLDFDANRSFAQVKKTIKDALPPGVS